MKIKCNMCLNESERKCLIKKTTVNVTKSRKCNDYEFDQPRDIVRLERKARLMDQQEARVKAQQEAYIAAEELIENNTRHPSTGDLSRFKSSAAE